MAIDRLTHVGDIKVGKVKGSSRIYPQLQLPSQYASLAGQKASEYEINGKEEDFAFLIFFTIFGRSIKQDICFVHSHILLSRG